MKMYFERYHLNRPPFEETTNPAFFHASKAHLAVLTKILDCLRNDGGMILAPGVRGCGKTMLSQVLIQRVQSGARCVALCMPEGGGNALDRIFTAVHMESPERTKLDQRSRRIAKTLAEHGYQCCAIIIDQAENLSVDDLLALERLIHDAAAVKVKLHIVLFADAEIEQILRADALRSLSKSMVRTATLSYLSRKDTIVYLATRLSAAGGRGGALFTRGAMRRIAQSAQGQPRRINELAKRALIVAARRDKTEIDEECVQMGNQETQAMSARPTDQSSFEQVDQASPPAPAVAPAAIGQTMPAASDPDALRALVERFEQALATAPDRLAELEAGVNRLQCKADEVVTRAIERVESRAYAAPTDSPQVAEALERLQQLEQASADALKVQEMLNDSARELAEVGQVSEERVALLLTSLESAQGIHDKLESAGAEVTGLVEESHGTVLAERDTLQAMFDELSERREEISRMIVAARTEREAALSEHRHALEQQLVQTRNEAETLRRELGDVIKTARKERMVALAEHKESIDQQITQTRADLDKAQTFATGALERIQQALTNAHNDNEAVIKRNKQAIEKQTSAMRVAADEVRADCDKTLEEARRLENATREALRIVDEQTRVHEERLRTAAASQERSDELIKVAGVASAQLQARVKQAGAATESLMVAGERIADRMKENNAALEQVKAEGVAALSKVAARAEDRLNEGLSRFESLIATEKSAKEAAEQAIRGARSALVKVAETESKLSEAQEAAINIEATASASLAAVHKQVKRIEDSVSTVVTHGVERAQGEIVAILTDCQRQIETSAHASVLAANDASQRLETEASATLQTVAARHAAVLEAVESATQSVRHIAEERMEAARRAVDDAAAGAMAQVHDAQTFALTEWQRELENARAEIATAQNATIRISGDANSEMSETRKAIMADITTRWEKAWTRIEAAKQAVVDEADGAIGRVHESQTSTLAVLRKELEEAIATTKQACAEMVDKIDETQTSALADLHAEFAAAGEQIHESREAAERVCGTAIDQVTKTQSATIVDLRKRLEEAGGHMDTLVKSAAQRFDADARACADAASESILSTGQKESDKVKATATSAAASAAERIAAATTSAASSIQERIAAATQMARKLREVDAQTRSTVSEAATCREKIDHLIRDVWSLTSTTDQRARALAALSENLAYSEQNIEKMVQRADARSADLAARTAEAQASAERLAACQGQSIEACDTLADQIREFTLVHEQLARGGEVGRALHEGLANQAGELKSLVATASTLIHNIHSEHEKAQATTESVRQLTETTNKIEARVQELNDALANPFSVIKDARDQADELNDICLAVKRVFRGVSQASLDANERIKVLGKFLAASERSSETMKQWVEEAGRAQARLAATLRQTPGIEDTHPLVALPELGKGAYPTELRGATYTAEDLAMIRQTAVMAEPAGRQPLETVSFVPKPIATTLAKPATTAPAKSAPTEQAEPAAKTPAKPASTTLEHVQRLVKAAGAKDQAAEVAAVRKSNEAARQTAVATTATKTGSQASQSPQTRLRPEDVRALIEAAKKKAGAKT